MRSERKQAEKQLILIFPAKNSLLEAILYRLCYRAGALALFILAALTPKNYRIKIHTQKIFWSKRDFVSGALVAISCNTANACQSYRLADRFRKAGSTVVMGGVHVSHLPEEALQHCDSVVIGEAESVWPQLIRDYEKGCLSRVYHGEPLHDWASASYEYFLSLPPAELRRMGFLLGRGCKYRCEFCVPFFGKPRFMKLEQAVGLISRSMEVSAASARNRVVTFFDDNIFGDPCYAKQLFRALIPMKLRWTGSSSLDIAFDDEALQLAKESGCYLLFIGFETIYPDRFPKTSVGGIKTPEDYIKAIRKIQSYGIMVKGGFILGFDDCTHKYCFELLKFLLRSGLDSADVTILTPFPGSRLFDRFKAENRMATCDWSKIDPGSPHAFKLKHMSPAALYWWRMLLTIVGLLSTSSVSWRVVKVSSALYVAIFVVLCVVLLGIIVLKNLYLLLWWGILSLIYFLF